MRKPGSFWSGVDQANASVEHFAGAREGVTSSHIALPHMTTARLVRSISPTPNNSTVRTSLTPEPSTPQRTGQAPCRARASARACTRCCSSASSPAEGGPTCCFGAASSCTAREGPPLTFLSLRQQSRRSRWRSRRMASTLHPPTATTPSRCGLLSRPGNSWGHHRNAPPITRASSHAPARTARSRGRARGGAAARTGTVA